MPVIATIGALTAVASAGMSIGQAMNAQKNIAKANREADKFMAEARKKLDVNYLEGLVLPTEAYDLEREAGLVAAAQAMEGARESERGAAAGAGRVLAASNQAQQASRASLAQDKMELDKLIADEEKRLRDERVKLDLGEVAGAQIARKEQTMIKNKAINNVFSNLNTAATYGEELFKLYPDDGSDVDLSGLESTTDGTLTKRKSADINLGTDYKALVEDPLGLEYNPDAVRSSDKEAFFTDDQVKAMWGTKVPRETWEKMTAKQRGKFGQNGGTYE